MRDFCFSAGGRTSTTSMRTSSGRSTRSNASNPFFQQRRNLDEFPMEHSLQDTHRLFQERRVSQAKQRENLISNNGQSKQLSSYSRKRFETALTHKGETPLPPPSPEERTLFWDESKPSWSRRRHLSMSAQPVVKPVELSPRPGSGPPGGATVGDGRRESPGGRAGFNHLRGNNSAYPTIRRLLLESNDEYRVVCPTTLTDCKYDRCRRPSVDCSSKSDFLLIPLEDEEEVAEEKNEEEEEQEQEQVEEVPVAKEEEDRLQEEMLLMAKVVDVEDAAESPRVSPTEKKASKMLKNKSAIVQKSTSVSETTKAGGKSSMDVKEPSKFEAKGPEDVRLSEVLEEAEEEEEEDGPDSPWHCWVDDATVSSVTSKKSDPEAATADGSPSQSPAPEVAAEQIPPAVSMETNLLNVPTDKIVSRKNSGSLAKKGSNTSRGQSKTPKGKRKGAKHSATELVEEIIELPPPPPPVVEEVIEEVKEEEPPEPVLPSYICPSSVIKSTQAEIKLWLHKSTFSSANRLLPIY